MQLNLDFQPRISSGKKTERITITCSDEFKTLVNLISKLTNTDVSVMGHRYFIEGMQRDIGNVFMAEPHVEKSLRDILSKNF